MKRGDMDSTLANPSKDVDVHMDARGLNFSCTTCHVSFSHEIDGRRYKIPPEGKRKFALPKDDGHRIRCESCHGNTPHDYRKLNQHTSRVACVTCHIPAYARTMPTNIWWDWSTAGRFTSDHKPIIQKDEYGKPSYHSKKGSMKWGKDLIPIYRWFNGKMEYTLVTDKKEPVNGVIILNKPLGSPNDPDSRIYPFKVHKGKQPYDPINKTMIIPKLFGKKGSGAFWAQYDWLLAAKAGMKEAGRPFSGKLEFVKTAYYLPLAHMIPPKEKAVECGQCHTVKNSRLAGIQGIYMPRRDGFPWLDRIGWYLVMASLATVLIHGLLRIVLVRRHERCAGGNEK